MELDDFFKRQQQEQEQKREAERALYEKQKKVREAKEEFEKKLPDFFKDVVDPAIQTVVNRFKEERLDGIYAMIGRRFRAARPYQRIDRDFYVEFRRNAVQFHIFAQTDSLQIVVEVTTDPKSDEFKTVDKTKTYAIEKFNAEVLLRMTGTALETLETLMNKGKRKNEEVIRL